VTNQSTQQHEGSRGLSANISKTVSRSVTCQSGINSNLKQAF